MIKNTRFLAALLALLGLPVAGLQAQTGPFSPDAWPSIVNATATVRYVSVAEALAAPGAGWTSALQILSGGDQITDPINIGGKDALKVIGTYLNIADPEYIDWADDEQIDILMLVYGDAAVLSGAGEPRNFAFLTGGLPELNFPVGGSLPVEAKNNKWNWVLFRIANDTRPSDGGRYVGSAAPPGGVNGGTIRAEGVQNLIVAAVAFGPLGAFGEPEAINLFAPPDLCDPEPETNLVFHDVAASQTNHLVLISDGDQTVTVESDIGPAADKRRAARPDGTFMNFGITDNYLGKPCNDPRAVKVCVEYFDDAALVGTVFGPEAYATDAASGIGFYPEAQRETTRGTGTWQRRSWVVPSVNLRGVNTGTLTGGPRLVFGAPLHVSRFDLAVFRTGEHPLAGQDPLEECFADPNICTDAYGSFAEMDLATGLQDGLAPGTSGGDQEMIQAEAGPASDRRMAVRPAGDDGTPGPAHQYLNLSITDEKLGPTSQPNARLAICMTYYDDPALIGATFRPEVYQSERNGVVTLAFTGGDIAIPLEGTDTWREAYFELPDVKFNGVNQGPQAAARFHVTGKVFFSRVRYAVIRPCGPNEGVNALEDCKPAAAGPTLTIATAANNSLRLSWPVADEGFALQSSPGLVPADWQPTGINPTVEGNENVVVIPAPADTRFYRLAK